MLSAYGYGQRALEKGGTNPCSHLVAFLGLNVEPPALQEVIEKHRPERAGEGQKGTHFSKGINGHFQEVYTAEEQDVLLEVLGPYLDRMGYESYQTRVRRRLDGAQSFNL
jgi:hypothetical protein